MESPERTNREDADAVEAPPDQEEQAIEGGSVSVGGNPQEATYEQQQEEDDEDEDEPEREPAKKKQ